MVLLLGMSTECLAVFLEALALSVLGLVSLEHWLSWVLGQSWALAVFSTCVVMPINCLSTLHQLWAQTVIPYLDRLQHRLITDEPSVLCSWCVSCLCSPGSILCVLLLEQSCALCMFLYMASLVYHSVSSNNWSVLCTTMCVDILGLSWTLSVCVCLSASLEHSVWWCTWPVLCTGVIEYLTSLGQLSSPEHVCCPVSDQTWELCVCSSTWTIPYTLCFLGHGQSYVQSVWIPGQSWAI